MSERVRNFLVIIALAIVAVLVTNRLVQLGKLPLKLPTNSPLLKNLSQVNQSALGGQPSTQTRVVVSEEDAVTTAVQKSSPSVVAIGINQRLANPETLI
jgi:cell division protein FtsN